MLQASVNIKPQNATLYKKNIIIYHINNKPLINGFQFYFLENLCSELDREINTRLTLQNQLRGKEKVDNLQYLFAILKRSFENFKTLFEDSSPM